MALLLWHTMNAVYDPDGDACVSYSVLLHWRLKKGIGTSVKKVHLTCVDSMEPRRGQCY